MKHSGQVRIIGGAWRSRKLSFPAVANLRPSPDAVRETLFNWLQYDLPGCRCLDLFAGSGAFGFEAASRGAVAVTMVESNPKAIAALERNCAALNAGHIVSLAKQDAWLFLQRCTAPFDVVFTDPPFQLQAENSILHSLENSSAITAGSLVYLESPESNTPLPIRPGWHIIRQKTRGLVHSTLMRKTDER